MPGSPDRSAARAAGGRIHGGLAGPELRALGVAPDDILDLSVSCNPFGPSPEVVSAIRAARLDRYPDPTGTEAREAIARALDLTPEWIALGNGAAELLWTLAGVLVRPGDGVVVVEPTFAELRAAAAHAGGTIHEWRASAARHFSVDLEAVSRLLLETGATTAYLAAPSSPAGAPVPAAAIARLAEENPGTAFIVDQSFLSMSESFAELGAPMPYNAVRVRSMTKDHSIPGIRIGYLVAPPALVARVEESRPAWTTSAPAQAAAAAACRASDFVTRCRARVLAARADLAASLGAIGLAPVPSSTGFLIVHTGPAAPLRDRLLTRHRILVRDCASFGLPNYIRVAARQHDDHVRLTRALAEELA